ncbi:hypothetical protein Asp14428_19500 [Actinoplanes sp. NBRC 14428]|nr:hypothetical protein Asp14428_19500 [Actinoplanes sp. NBRC 14428]
MTDTRLSSVADRLDIIELTARYAFLLDTNDIDTLLELWTDDDPVFDIEEFGLGKAVGKDQIRHYLEVAIYGQNENLCHLTTNHVINELGESSASGTCHVLALADVRVGGSSQASAFYRDEYVRQDGKWKFSYRKVFPLTRPEAGNFQLPSSKVEA